MCRAIEQAEPRDEAARQIKDRRFGLGLGAAVGQDGPRLVFFAIPRARAVEDEVGRGEEQPPPVVAAPSGQRSGSLDVDGVPPGWIVSDLVRRADRRGMNDQVWLGLVQGREDGLLAGQVDRVNRQAEVALPAGACSRR